MSFFKGLIDSCGSIFTDTYSYESQQNPSSSSNTMDGGGVAGSSVTNEHELKGFFDLAKEEIDKAVRAEEWGLTDNAIIHYKNAQRILAKASSMPVPSYISSSEPLRVNFYRQKILTWKGQVSDELQALSRRTACSSTNKDSLTHAHITEVALKTFSVQTDNIVSSKPVQDPGLGYDENLVEMINTAIEDRSPSVKWEDVAGHEKAKQALMEMVILPTRRRDLFTGLRKPARGLLLFGPPGNGKTMLAKAVASESEATFFNVSAASLTSKWVGEGEKLVRTLFRVAKTRQPSIIFMDEIDRIMSTRVGNENEASRRLMSEFLVQFDGVTSNSGELVIVIGATNNPQELDDAVLRRLLKRIYIPLPDENSRRLLLKYILKGQSFGYLEKLVQETDGYSGSDLQALCEEAAMMPIRELGANILTVRANQVRSLKYDDFKKAATVIRPSPQKSNWKELEQWNQEFGAS